MKKIIAGVLFTISCVSCVNLESEMYDTINLDMFPKTESDAEALVTSAAYSPFRSNFYDGIFTNAADGIQIMGDMTTDLGYCQWTDSWWPDMLNFNFTVNSERIGTPYIYVRDISKMTLTIDRIKDIPMDDN